MDLCVGREQNVPGIRPRLRMLEMVKNGEEEAASMPHGVTGDESVGSIPFQVTLFVANFGLKM